MYTEVIELKRMNDVPRFIQITSMFDLNIDIKSGNRMVDGKSILGIYSLDLTRPMELCIASENSNKLREIKALLSKENFI